MKVRVKFSKHGVMKYIGHLDIMRYFQKAMRRADIDIAYSEGFSPHQIMSFAAPLGVGLESDGEYFDIELLTHNGREDFIDRLNEAMVDGIHIEDAVRLPEGVTNAMASVAAAGYIVSPKPDAICQKVFECGTAKLISEFMEQTSVVITKKTKKGEQELDIKPHIYELKACEGGIYMLVDASSSGNLKPAAVLRALCTFGNIPFADTDIHINRTDTYTFSEQDDIKKLAPLGCVGEDF